MMIQDNVVATLDIEVKKHFQRLEGVARARWPNGSLSVSALRRDDCSARILSMLHTKDGDQIELEVALRTAGGGFECSATMYIGQESLLTLSCSFWSPSRPVDEQLTDLIGEFISLAEPRWFAAIDAVGSSAA